MEGYIVGGIPSLLMIENLQSSQIPSGLSVLLTPQILQIIDYNQVMNNLYL
jgi:hypothetical protein